MPYGKRETIPLLRPQPEERCVIRRGEQELDLPFAIHRRLRRDEGRAVSFVDHGSLTSTMAKDLGNVAGFADSWTTTRSQLSSMEVTTGVPLIATKEPGAKVLDRMGG